MDKNKILAKVLSGRYFLTVIGGLVFSYAVYAKILDNQATAAILTAIFMSYFQRSRTNENGTDRDAPK